MPSFEIRPGLLHALLALSITLFIVGLVQLPLGPPPAAPLIPLEASGWQPNGGYAFTLDVSSLGLHGVGGSQGGFALTFLEDGRRLRRNDVHDDIREQGGGLYSLWNGVLYLASSDGTDPRTNGKSYAIAPPPLTHGQARLALSMIGIAGLIALVAALAAVWRRRREPDLRRMLTFFLVASAVTLFVARVLYSVPIVAHDYAHMIDGAENLLAGNGLINRGSTQTDTLFVTRWPMGLGLALVSVKALTGWSIPSMLPYMSALALALAFTAWFGFLFAVCHRAVSCLLLAVGGSSCLVDLSILAEPSTDVLLLGCSGLFGLWLVRLDEEGRYSGLEMALLGLASGGMFWIRYAGVFLAAGIGLFLALSVWRGRCRPTALVVFGSLAALSVGALMWINASFGSHATLITAPQAFRFEASYVAQAFTNWARLPLIMHRGEGWLVSLSSLAVLVPLLGFMRVSRLDVLRRHLASSHYRVGVCFLGAMLPLVVAASVAESYDYTVNPRQFVFVRPLVFVLVVVPALLVVTRNRIFWRSLSGLFLVAVVTHQADSLRQDVLQTPRPLQTAYGRNDVNFRPHLGAVVTWLEQNTSATDLIVSTYYDELCLESGLPVKPLLTDMASATATAWGLSKARGVAIDRLVVVLPTTTAGHRELPDRVSLEQLFGLQRITEGALKDVVLAAALPAG